MNAVEIKKIQSKHPVNWKKRIAHIVIFTVLTVIGAVFAIPFLWMVIISFDMTAKVYIPYPPTLYPKEFTFEFYQEAIASLDLVRIYTNTFAVVIGVVVISVFCALLAAYAIEKLRFKGHKAVFALCLSTMMIPSEATLIPRFMLFMDLKLVNNYWAFWLPAVAYTFGIFFAKQFFRGIPDSLREAALIDGAGDFRIFLQVVVPLCGAMVATLVILQFLGQWNDFLWPLIILQSSDKYTIQVALSVYKSTISPAGTTGGTALYPAKTMAATMLSVLPVLIMYLFMQRFILQSVATAGIKQ